MDGLIATGVFIQKGKTLNSHSTHIKPPEYPFPTSILSRVKCEAILLQKPRYTLVLVDLFTLVQLKSKGSFFGQLWAG